MLAVLVVVLALVAGGLAAWRTKLFTPSHPVPALTGLTLAQAKAAAAKDHFTVHVEKGVPSITAAAGVVLTQSPVPRHGRTLKQGSVLSVQPSSGPPLVTVPSLTGTTCAQAINVVLKNAHLNGACGTAQYSLTVGNSFLITWTYNGQSDPTTAPYGATIDLVPSMGHPPVDVPTSISQSDTFGEAQSALVAVGLTATQVSAPSNTVPDGDVIRTTPLDGQPAPYGSAVTVTVSTGPPTVVVPNVAGDLVSQADQTLTDAGLIVAGVDGNPNGTVVGTDPGMGTTVDTGSQVTILSQ
jgi:serine/threonine-protein kinase